VLDLKKIGEQLCMFRQKNGLSQEGLAEKLFVSHQAVSRWETGKSLPNIDTIIALTELYKTSLDTILCLNIELETDLDILFKNHSRTFVIDQIIHKQIKTYDVNDIIHLLNQEERYYVLSMYLKEAIHFNLNYLWPRLSLEERRMIIMHHIEFKYPKNLNEIWSMLNSFEKKLLMKEGKK
jgi:transcriptional regulator with XRE-family HTH domain